jgi:hypothetical protein
MSTPGTFMRLSEDWEEPGWMRFPRSFARDRRLSWRARGVALYLASHSPTFAISTTELSKVATEGRDATRSAVNELKELGYLTTHRRADGAMEYQLHREPVAAAREPQPENPSEAPDQPVTDSQAPENPSPENPSTYKGDAVPQETEKDLEQTHVAVPAPDADDALFAVEGSPKKAPVPALGEFEEAWVLIGRRGSKKKAQEIWGAALRRLGKQFDLQTVEEQAAAMVERVRNYAANEPREKYRKHFERRVRPAATFRRRDVAALHLGFWTERRRTVALGGPVGRRSGGKRGSV